MVPGCGQETRGAAWSYIGLSYQRGLSHADCGLSLGSEECGDCLWHHMDLRVVSGALDGASRRSNRKLGERRRQDGENRVLKNKEHLNGA